MSESKRAHVNRMSLVRARGVHGAREGEEGRAREEERRKDEGGKKETNNRSRLARPGRASTIATFPGRKTDPEPRGRSDCNRRRRLHWRAADMHEPENERASERASERMAGHAEVNGCSARERFFGPENVRRGCQPGYLVRGTHRAGARHGHFAARERAKSRVVAE